MIRQSKSALVESIVELKNTQLEFARGNTERLTNPPYCLALLKNTLLSPPETKEKERPPDIKERESIPAVKCSAVLKKIQLSPPEIANKNLFC